MNFYRLSKIKYKDNNNSFNENSDEINNVINNENNNGNNEIYEIIIQNRTINYEKKYQINTENYIFIVNQKNMKSGDKYYEIFNEKGKICVKIVKYNDNEGTIYLQNLNYFESCSKNKSLMRKHGTLEMLNGILEFVYKENSDCNYYFEDDSSITIEGKKISLNILYILLYGKTWYMKNINAIPLDKDFIDKLERLNNYLDTNKDELKSFLKIEYQDDIINREKLNNILSTSNNKNIKINNLKKIYEDASSSRDFLQKIYKKYGMGIFLLVNYYGYYEYINRKIAIKLNFNIMMEIPKEYINNISVIKEVIET
jgi:hypothetical protein